MQSNATTAVSLPNESTIICEQPGGYVADGVLLSLWRVVYWSAQLLTWYCWFESLSIDANLISGSFFH
jgi:hypothetical protein